MTADLKKRRLVPEMLDTLPAEDPAAQRSRRDLRRINALMAQSAIASRLIRRHAASVITQVADIGCGDGSGAFRVLRRLGPAPVAARLTLVDANLVPDDATLAHLSRLGWRVEVVRADIFDWLEEASGRQDLMMTNLFLHHFDGADLDRLMRGCASRTGLFVATEPDRSLTSLAGSRLVGVIGANAVTRHDAPASVRAGFTGTDLGVLWPGRTLYEGRRLPFTHAFVGEGLAHA